MARLVKKTAHTPQLVGDKLICMCGLSKNQPFCDKSHLKTQKEDDAKLYWYEGDKVEEVETIDDSCCSEGCCGECKGECEGEECCGGECCQNEENLKKEK